MQQSIGIIFSTAAEYNSPLFLDCCGLIRRALRDLKEHFGFEIGPWNQAYMVREVITGQWVSREFAQRSTL